MKKLLFFSFSVLFLLLFSSQVQAECFERTEYDNAGGKTITYRSAISGAINGECKTCYQAYEGAVCVVVASRRSYHSRQNMYELDCDCDDPREPRRSYHQRRYSHNNDYIRRTSRYRDYDYRSYERDHEPIYEDQRIRTSRNNYNVGIDPYTGRPYGNYSRSSEKTELQIRTNRYDYRPELKIRVYDYNYQWPYRRYW